MLKSAEMSAEISDRSSPSNDSAIFVDPRMNNSSVAGVCRFRLAVAENWNSRLRWGQSARFERASGQRAVSRHAETKTDGEFTPALCAWIIHAPPGLSPGEPRLSYYRAYRLRPAERATWGRKIREKRRAEKGRLSKAKRRARLTKRMERRRVAPPLKPALVLLATARIFLFWRYYYSVSSTSSRKNRRRPWTITFCRDVFRYLKAPRIM